MEEIDDLFALPPDRFISARDELAHRLAKEDDEEGAAEVKKLRKPTLVAWALNQLQRRHGKDLSRLLDAGEALRTAQRRAASGAADSGFQDATEGRRRAVRDLAVKATRILEEAGKPGPAAEAEIGRTLEAASIDPEAGQQLVQGRLSRPISTVPGFDSVGGFEVISGSGGGTDMEGLDTGSSASRAALRNAQRQMEKAESEAHRARMRAETLKQEAEEMTRRADVALEEAHHLEGEVERAREKLERARADADRP